MLATGLKLTAIAAILTSGFAVGTAHSGLMQVPAVETKSTFSFVDYRTYRHRHIKRNLRAERRERRRSGDLPQAHIDYCIRQNMDYNPSNNTIAIDRWSRVQCASPYYRP